MKIFNRHSHQEDCQLSARNGLDHVCLNFLRPCSFLGFGNYTVIKWSSWPHCRKRTDLSFSSFGPVSSIIKLEPTLFEWRRRAGGAKIMHWMSVYFRPEDTTRYKGIYIRDYNANWRRWWSTRWRFHRWRYLHQRGEKRRVKGGKKDSLWLTPFDPGWRRPVIVSCVAAYVTSSNDEPATAEATSSSRPSSYPFGAIVWLSAKSSSTDTLYSRSMSNVND